MFLRGNEFDPAMRTIPVHHFESPHFILAMQRGSVNGQNLPDLLE
jgi:folylpolyglutamate synthase/dihydropteroate synthase